MGTKMNLKDGIAALDQPGDFFFRRTDDSPLMFVGVLPNGELCAIPVHRHNEQPARNPSWAWDDNEAGPTLRPSIVQQGEKAWHGFVTNGEMITC